jgi:hypothetical protein
MMRMFAAALVAFAVSFSATAYANAAPGRVAFDIFRNGEKTGTHSVDVTTQGDTTIARIAIDMAGRVGPFSYSYKHRCTETWRADKLVALDCSDEERGKPMKRVRAALNAQGQLAVTANGVVSATVSNSALPSSWWRESLVRQSQIINTRTGKLAPLRVQRIGDESVSGLSGDTTRATHYRLRGTVNADIWYDQQGRWTKMRFRLSGQNFEYRKRTPLGSGPSAR